MITTGDCVEVMATMDAASVDAIVTDPPYGLEFMGKEWDRLDAGLPQENVWKGRRGKGGSSISDDKATPASRHGVALGGGKSAFKRCLLCGKRSFSGSPCQCAEPQWVIEYPDGAPSSVIRMGRWHELWAREAYRIAKPGAYLLSFGGTRTYHRMACAIEDAGWIIRDCLVWAYASGFPKSRALLKPAWEPIVMARKPGPLRELAIDACRLPIAADEPNVRTTPTMGPPGMFGVSGHNGQNLTGRWPANLILTDPIFDGDTPGVVGGGETSSGNPFGAVNHGGSGFLAGSAPRPLDGYGDTGTYSRFFLVPKADRAEREPVLGELAGIPRRQQQASIHADPDAAWADKNPNHPRINGHPTVKPLDLMRHLVRLVTPTGGVVLDPFLGSGTTALAAEMEGFAWLGIEREPEYVAIAEARLNGTQKGLGLPA